MFGFRVPQLHSRDARAEPCRPDSYPATCHSQAWSSASAVLILRSWLGLELDVPSCVVRSPAVTGLRIVGHPVSFDSATLTGLPGDLMLV